MDREWVIQEWTSYLAAHKPRNRLLPVLLESVTLPTVLKPIQAIDATDREVEEMLISSPRPIKRLENGHQEQRANRDDSFWS